MKKITLFLGITICLLALAALADTIDKIGRTDRYRIGSKITFDTSSTIADEDAAWSLSNAKLSRVAGWSATAGTLTLAGTTNQIAFAGTNNAPASGTPVYWISVRITGDTNTYRMGICL